MTYKIVLNDFEDNYGREVIAPEGIVLVNDGNKEFENYRHGGVRTKV